jgi:hypothetical protein
MSPPRSLSSVFSGPLEQYQRVMLRDRRERRSGIAGASGPGQKNTPLPSGNGVYGPSKSVR